MTGMFLVLPRFRLRISVFAFPAMLVMLYIEGVVPFFIMLISALLHELGHLTVMRLMRHRPRRVDVLPMGALIVCPEGIPDRDEAIIAASGPTVSLLMSLASGAVFLSTRSVDALFPALVNFIFGFFNLLPVRKLDGGKALSCFLSGRVDDKKRDRICRISDLVSKLIFALILALAVCMSGYNPGVFMLSLSLLLQL